MIGQDVGPREHNWLNCYSCGQGDTRGRSQHQVDKGGMLNVLSSNKSSQGHIIDLFGPDGSDEEHKADMFEEFDRGDSFDAPCEVCCNTGFRRHCGDPTPV